MDNLRLSHHRLGQRRRDDSGDRAGYPAASAASRGRPARTLAGGGLGIAVPQYAAAVQLLFWYFAAWNLLPLGARDFINDDHSWSILPGNVWWLTPEFLCSMWGLGVFTSAFLIEEIASGLRAVSHGQREAALSQGFTPWQELRHILLPQGLANAWQPIIGQYLNLMKLSSLASGIGFAELTYQVRQIESYNAHALEAFAVGTALYLALGVLMGVALTRLGPGRDQQRRAGYER